MVWYALLRGGEIDKKCYLTWFQWYSILFKHICMEHELYGEKETGNNAKMKREICWSWS